LLSANWPIAQGGGTARSGLWICDPDSLRHVVSVFAAMRPYFKFEISAVPVKILRARYVGRKFLLDAVLAGASFGIGYQNRLGTEVKVIVVRYRKVQGAAAPIRILRTFVGAHFLELMNKATAVREISRLTHGVPLARQSRFAIGALVLNALTLFF
jgi:hypothetical protein